MSDRIRTVDMSDPAVVLDCYRKLNVAYKELKAENEKLRAALMPLAEYEFDDFDDDEDETASPFILFKHIRAAAAALKEIE